jgi:urocanate hydratase
MRRVLIANSNLVPKWATWEHFNELDRKGLMMFGQMTAGSWIYIGSQGIVQEPTRRLRSGRQHYGGQLADRWILTGGLGGMGARSRSRDDGRRIDASRSNASNANRHVCEHVIWIDKRVTPALAFSPRAKAAAVSIGLLGNAAEILPVLASEGFVPTW